MNNYCPDFGRKEECDQGKQEREGAQWKKKLREAQESEKAEKYFDCEIACYTHTLQSSPFLPSHIKWIKSEKICFCFLEVLSLYFFARSMHGYSFSMQWERASVCPSSKKKFFFSLQPLPTWRFMFRFKKNKKKDWLHLYIRFLYSYLNLFSFIFNMCLCEQQSAFCFM